jgi:hypothetical protein
VVNRKWASVGTNQLFLDDLGDDRLKGLTGGLLLATPGHLGQTRDEQYRVADLLGIRRISSRFTVSLVFGELKSLPESWNRALESIMDLLYSYAQEDDAANVPTTRPSFEHFGHVKKELLDDGVPIGSWNVYAARDAGRICIAGPPDDFAADLCRVLLQWAGLANRRDLDELAPRLTQLIGWVDRPEKFGPQLQELRARRGLVPPQQFPTQLPSASDNTTTTSVAEQQDQTALSGPESPTPPTRNAPTFSGATASSGQPADETATAAGNSEVPPQSGGYTTHDREARLQSLRKQVKELLGVGAVPKEPETDTDDTVGQSKPFGSDVAYRQAVVDFEGEAGRYAETKDAGQPGYDIDSFDRPLKDASRRLVRRIEVKGHGCDWTDDETVEVSDRQFLDAVGRKVDNAILSEEFDYWLYVVERRQDGMLHVIPIRNPAKRAAKFEFRVATWRELAEEIESEN